MEREKKDQGGHLTEEANGLGKVDVAELALLRSQSRELSCA